MAKEVQGPETKEQVIDGVTYSVTQLTGTRSLKLFWKLVGVISGAGDSLGKLDPAALASGDVGDIDMSVAGGALGGIVSKLDPDQLDVVVKELLGTLTIDGRDAGPLFESHFAGKVFRMLKVVKFALGVHFGDFRDALRGGGSAGPKAGS